MANLVPVNNNQLSKKINPNSFFGKKAKVGTTKIKSKGTTLRSEFVLIRKKVIKIDKLLNIFIKLEKKNQESNRRKGELSAREKSESKLEKKKKKETGLSFPSIPVGGNFLESIKRFLFFTFLNIALPKLLELLPKLRELGKAIAPVTNFLLNIVGGIGKGLLSGFVNFIDWGYKIRDNTEKTIKQIGGDKAAKDFNEFNKRLNTFIDLSILAGLTALDIGLDAQKYRKKQLEDQKKRGGVKPRVTEGRGGQKPIGRPKVTTGIGGKAGAGTVTQGRGGKPLDKFSKFKSGPFAKFAGPIGKFLGAATPFLGAGIGAADAAARFSSGDKVGGALASASAALDAFSGVAAITGFGLPLAGIATGISIGIDIVLLVRDLIKVMLPGVPMFRNGGRIKLFAQGGRVGSSGRTIKAQRKTFGAKSFKQEVKPGKDIGGKQQILKLFPDPSSENRQQTIAASPWWERWLGGKNQTTQTSGKPANPYKALKTTAEILGKIPGPFGKLMSAGASIPLGQKPDRDIGRGFGSFVGQITQDIIDNNVNLSFGNIVKSISGFAGGGDIRNQNIMKNNDIGYQVGQVVEKAIGSLISSKVNEAVSSIQREISSIGKPTEEYLTPPLSPGGDDNVPIDVDPSDVIGRVGNTGLSSAPHIHIEDYSAPGGQIPTSVSSSILVDGKPMTSGVKTSPVGWRTHPVLGTKKYHAGEDWDNNWNGKPISLTGGLKFVKYVSEGSDPRFSGYGNVVVVQSPDGKKYFLGHLSSGPRNLQALQQRQQQLQTQNLQQMRPTGNSISGQASWYGPGFQGEKTASGEIYDMNKMTAAMYRPGWGVGSNPFYVEVTNIDNNKKVRVKVNDTGPFAMHSNGEPIYPLRSHPTRIIDLSKSAMNKLGGSGVINVRVEKLGSAPVTKSPTKQSPVAKPASSNANIINATTMSGQQIKTAILNIKPGQKIVFPGIGSVQGGKDFLGRSQTKYYDSQGNDIGVNEFTERYRNSQLRKQIQQGAIQSSTPPGAVPPANLPNRFSGSTIEELNKRGTLSSSLAPSQKKQSVDSLAFTPSYAEGQSGFLAIQPIRETLIQQA